MGDCMMLIQWNWIITCLSCSLVVHLPIGVLKVDAFGNVVRSFTEAFMPTISLLFHSFVSKLGGSKLRNPFQHLKIIAKESYPVQKSICFQLWHFYYAMQRVEGIICWCNWTLFWRFRTFLLHQLAVLLAVQFSNWNWWIHWCLSECKVYSWNYSCPPTTFHFSHPEGQNVSFYVELVGYKVREASVHPCCLNCCPVDSNRSMM